MGYDRRLFHYTHSPDIARKIARSGVLIPRAQELPSGLNVPETYCCSRVNLTSVPPEEGADAIASATGIDVDPAFALELLVDSERYRLTQPYRDQFPESYQIFTEEPVAVKVNRTWNVDRAYRKAQRGSRIKRFGPELNFLSMMY